MFFLLTYYSPAEFREKCKEGITSSYHGVLKNAESHIYDDYQEDKWIGSICPSTNDMESLKLLAFPKLHSKMQQLNYNYDNSGGGIRCLGSDVGGEVGKNFPSHRCYSFMMHLYTSCSANAYMYIEVKNRSTGQVTRPPLDIIYTCEYDDCLPGYWGENCENGPVYYDASKNCEVSLGLKGTGKCTCANAEKIQQYCRPGTKEGMKLNIYESNKEKIISSQIINNIDNIDVSNAPPFSYYVISGKLYIPKSGKYEFKLTGNTKVKFTIGKKDSNYISSVFACEKGPSETIVFDYLVADTLYDFKIEYVSGCTVMDKYLSIVWNFQDNQIFTPIPAKYLFY